MRCDVPSAWSARESAAARRESSVPRNACVGKSGGRRTHTPPPNGEKPGRDSDEKNNNNNNNNRTASVQRISVGYHSCAFAIENIIALQNGRQHEHMPQSSRRPWKTKIPTVATSVRRTSRSAKSRLVSTRRSEVVYAAAYHDSPYQTIIIWLSRYHHSRSTIRRQNGPHTAQSRHTANDGVPPTGRILLLLHIFCATTAVVNYGSQRRDEKKIYV